VRNTLMTRHTARRAALGVTVAGALVLAPAALQLQAASAAGGSGSGSSSKSSSGSAGKSSKPTSLPKHPRDNGGQSNFTEDFGGAVGEQGPPGTATPPQTAASSQSTPPGSPGRSGANLNRTNRVPTQRQPVRPGANTGPAGEPVVLVDRPSAVIPVGEVANKAPTTPGSRLMLTGFSAKSGRDMVLDVESVSVQRGSGLENRAVVSERGTSNRSWVGPGGSFSIGTGPGQAVTHNDLASIKVGMLPPRPQAPQPIAVQG
jgi:hypothetical protein